MTIWTIDGRVAVVTGGTDGIGRETARELARAGAIVALIGRNPEKTDRVCTAIRQEVPGAEVVPFVADLSDLGQIRRLAAQILERFPALGVLVNNAGAMFTERRLSADGLEMTFALNHLSYFALTHLLLDALRAGGPARIVNVSSKAHEGAVLDFDDLQMARGYSGLRAYGRSKLCNLYFTFSLARRLHEEAVTVNALHPGFVASAFGKNNPGFFFSTALKVAKQLAALSPEAGARTSVYLATSPDVEGITGEYFDRCAIAKPSKVARLAAEAERLWAVSNTLTGLG